MLVMAQLQGDSCPLAADEEVARSLEGYRREVKHLKSFESHVKVI